jgi:cellulose synthase (UDP-forming)
MLYTYQLNTTNILVPKLDEFSPGLFNYNTHSKKHEETTVESHSIYHSIFTKKEKIIGFFIFFIWLTIFIDFIFWWATKSQPRLPELYWLNTITVFWLPFLELYFFLFSLRQKEIKVETKIPPCRVAILTTKIPSESEDLLIRSLVAMKSQKFDYPYDVWLADEDHTPTMLEWCKQNGVNVSSRKNNPAYHNDTYPRKAKTKEGNVMYFYDKFGFENYDFVTQFDADHAPEPDFLEEAIKYFNNPNVGYVSSPSITDGNLKDSWTVAARCNWESTTHGPIQSGSNLGFSPMMFGSHYTHRIKALKEIGGIAPEIAEDHTTTLVYNASGWEGAFARNAIAHGYGAVGVEDSMLQEYQWALVGIRAMFLVTPRYFFKLNWKVKTQFMIWELWYPLLTIITLISYFLPVVALKIQNPIVAVEGYGFLWHYIPLLLISIGYAIWLRIMNHLRPAISWQVSWETAVFQILQFPWIALGVLEGLRQVIFRLPPSKIKITDKSEKVKGLSFILFAPHFLIVGLNLWAILSTNDAGDAFGYYWFSFTVIASHILAIILAIYLTLKESLIHLNSVESKKYIFKYLPTILSVSILTIFTILAFVHIINYTL